MRERGQSLRVLDEILDHGIDEIVADFGSKIFNGTMNDILQEKEEGEVTRSFDKLIEERIVHLLEKTDIPFRVNTEESGIFDLARDPEFLVIIDPLDGSDMAARGFPLCSVAISVVDMSAGIAVLSRIGDLATGAQYYAFEDTCGYSAGSIEPSIVENLAEAFIVLYAAKRERIPRITEVLPLLSQCKLYLNYGGPLDIARIATGRVDGFIEYTRGMGPRDTLPGMHILQNAGGVILGLDGQHENGRLFREERRTFIAAGNEILASKIWEEFKNCGIARV